jgi:predicted negative regulator of RcsB-dependent stress response
MSRQRCCTSTTGDILAMNGETDKAVAQWKRALEVAKIVGKDIEGLSKKINERKYID